MGLLLKTINMYFTALFLPAILFISGMYFAFRIGRYVFRPVFVMRTLLSKDKSEKKKRNVSEKKSNNIAWRKFFAVHEKRKNKTKKSYNENKSSVSPFSSLCLALAGTLGVGNISGVTAAIMAGGAGTIFWIWVCAAVSSVLKFAETVLALYFRQKDSSGSFHGGAHMYIKNGLNAPKTAVFFCVMCIITSFTMGSITQTKAAADGVFLSVKIPPVICGAIFFFTVLYLCFGGEKKISSFTLKIVPPLCLAYVILSVAVIFIFRHNIPYIISVIFSEAFTFRAGTFGILGFFCTPAMRYGLTRGIMSNEAGCGTAPIAHAKADTDSPVRQGFFGIAEVICDTLILCTLTAFVVLLSNTPLSGSSTEVAINSFASALGEPIKIFLGISIFLFALGSVAGWAFYGEESAKALGFGKKSLVIYGVLFAFSAFAGCIMPENTVWELADLSIAVMATVNTVAVLLLSPTVIKLTKDFCKKKTKK